MYESAALAPLDVEPVSVYAPYISYPGGKYRHEPVDERRAALHTALAGVQLGAYDQRMVTWLGAWDIPTVAAVVSLLWRTRYAGAQQARHRGRSGGPR
jgi:hypothetical protein